VEVNQYRLNGPGNGDPRSQMRIGEAGGGTTAAYVDVSQGRELANSVKFVEYDQRAHRLNTLASFSFWVSSKSSNSEATLPMLTKI
jgi:hypothetical protein